MAKDRKTGVIAASYYTHKRKSPKIIYTVLSDDYTSYNTGTRFYRKKNNVRCSFYVIRNKAYIEEFYN